LRLQYDHGKWKADYGTAIFPSALNTQFTKHFDTTTSTGTVGGWTISESECDYVDPSL